jgi:hypothetical protein
MTWQLVVIAVLGATPQAVLEGEYASMTDCFSARENIIHTLWNQDRAPVNYQVVCIQSDKYKH